jgi:hypothetical protein
MCCEGARNVFLNSSTALASALSRIVGRVVGKAEGSCVAREVLGGQGVLVLEEQAVGLPEQAVLGRAFRELGGGRCMRVSIDERKVPEDVAHIVADSVEHLRHSPGGLAAERALEVAVL